MAAIKVDKPKRVRVIPPIVPCTLVVGGVSFALFALGRGTRVQWDVFTMCGAAFVVVLMGYWAVRAFRKSDEFR